KKTAEDHGEAFKRIANVNPGSTVRAEELRQRERDAGDELVAHLGQSQFAEARVKQTRENSWEPTAELEQLREELLGWVTRMRALQEEIETCYLEAFYRERGEPG
ncbi:MAG: hypothetical protein KC944_14090, partial [Candidatus Omnitrophica bacterium]|nr:hypothetical protein [Candidatus Omnitrophota bacterium]